MDKREILEQQDIPVKYPELNQLLEQGTQELPARRIDTGYDWTCGVCGKRYDLRIGAHDCHPLQVKSITLEDNIVPVGPDDQDDGYDNLRHVLDLALRQASEGKGKERHANGKPFDRQPIMEIGRMVGAGYPLGQAMKKAQESARLPPDRAKAELLGAINYLAAAYLLLEG